MTKEQQESLDWLLDRTVRAAAIVVGAYVIGWAFTKGVLKATGSSKVRGLIVYRPKGE